jgi:hypothetical protein
MKPFGKERTMAALWDWLDRDNNYQELMQALDEFKKCAIVVEKRVDYLKKIDAFCTSIKGLKGVKKEQAEEHKKGILKAADELCDYIELDQALYTALDDLHSALVNAAYSIITMKINRIK